MAKPASTPAPELASPLSAAKGAKKGSNRKWLYIAGGVLVVALIVLMTRKSSSSEPEGTLAGGSLGAVDPAEGGGSAGTGTTGTGTTTLAPSTPPSGANIRGGAPLRPGEEREREETTEGGTVRISETGGEREPTPAAAAAAAAAGGAPGKRSRHAATRKLQEQAIAKGENPNTVKPAKKPATREKAGAKTRAKPKAATTHKAAAKKAPAKKAPAKPAAHKPAPAKAPARKPAPKKSTPKRKK